MSTNSNSLDSDPGPPPPTLDTVLGKLGDPGRYQVTRKNQKVKICNQMLQVVLMLLLATNYIPVVVNHLLMAFYTSKVSFNCRVGDDWVAKNAQPCPLNKDACMTNPRQATVNNLTKTQNAFEVPATTESLCVQKLIIFYDVKPLIAYTLCFITHQNYWNKTKRIYEATDRKSLSKLQSESMSSLFANFSVFWVRAVAVTALGSGITRKQFSMQNTCYDPY